MSDLPVDLDAPLWGAEAIAREIRRTPRQTYWSLENGDLPAGKMGSTWFSTRRRLRDFLNGNPQQTTTA